MKSASRTPPITVSLLLLLTACANIGPPQPPSLKLPKPPVDLRASRKGDKVTLTWTIPAVTTDRQHIRSVGPTRICRGLDLQLAECKNPVGKAPPLEVSASAAKEPTGKRSGKDSASYTDALPASLESDDPASFVTYAVEVENEEGRGGGLSNRAQVPLIRTLPAPSDFTAQITAQGVLLKWTGYVSRSPRDNLSYVYRAYRNDDGRTEQTLVGEVQISGDKSLSLTDSNIEWEKTYDYRVNAVTIIHEPGKSKIEVPGEDSLAIKVLAHDIFPPAVPSGLQAVFSGPGQQLFIDLVWAPDTDADLAGYNVYRREEGAAPTKLNSALITTPAYRDSEVLAGKPYFYSVAAVDVRGNESAKSEEASEKVP